MKTYLKLVFRTIKNNALRFIVLTLIVATGVGLSTGIGTLPEQISYSFEEHYEEVNYPSFVIKTKDESTNLNNVLDDLKDNEKVKDANGLIELDDEDGQRTYFLDFTNQTVNELNLVEGKLPEKRTEILVENETNFIEKHEIGEVINYKNPSLGIFEELELEVVGIVENPILTYKDEIPTNIDEDVSLKRVIYFDQNLVNIPFITDIHVLLNVDNNYNMFGGGYRDFIDEEIKIIEEDLNNESLVFLGPNDTVGYRTVQENIDKMISISLIFPIFFTFVIMIVVIASIGRLIEEERGQVGTLLSLGMPKFRITFRYYLLGILASIIGSILGVVIGYNTLGRLIYIGFGEMMVMPERTSELKIAFGIFVSLFILIIMILAIFIASTRQLREKPAELLRYKAPKPGSKIFLERITPLWKRIKFKYKSSLRNIFRYPLNFFMTVISLLGSTALIFAGVALYDNTQVIEGGYANLIEIISFLIVLFAAALSILVTYNLINMNIDERKREIATLKVLGYYKQEVRGYIFRETLIVSFIGILLGLPTGYFLVDLVFRLLDFGSVSNINWYTWPLVVLIALVFVGISDLLLIRKIDKIKMSESLQTVD